MPTYRVGIEVGPSGACMAHVLDLPGCLVRSIDRDAALDALPATIADYHDRLRRHGEQVPAADESISVIVAETWMDVGPFQRGDAAALFSPDRGPLDRTEMEYLLRIAGYNRRDLLALARNLSDSALDWNPDPEVMSVREILRHIGNVEQWYVSRIVDPETLPVEWADDENIPIFPFLNMERETAIARLRGLTDRELANISYPIRWTNHPNEPWTARKALRRLLEHEREHIDHIREVLAGYHGE